MSTGSSDSLIRLLDSSVLPNGKDGLDFCDLDSNTDASKHEFRSVLDEFRQLLGPLVHESMRNAKGALALQQIKAKSYSEFKNYLFNEAERCDGQNYGSPFNNLLADKKYEPLLKLLYRELNPQSEQYLLLSKSRFQELVKDFQLAIIDIDADAFARQYAPTSSGQQRLGGLLLQEDGLSKNQKSELIKAITRVGLEHGVVDEVDEADSISLWNYFNWGIDEQALKIATQWGALPILQQIGEVYQTAEAQRADLIKNSHFATSVSLDGTETPIDVKQLEEFTKLAQEGPQSLDASQQAQGYLAKLWLLAVDTRNWENQDFGYPTRLLRRNLMHACAGYIKKAGTIKTQKEFSAFRTTVHGFLKGRLQGGKSFSEALDEMPTPIKAPLTDLIQQCESWKHSIAMGQQVHLGEWNLKISDPKLKNQVQLLVQGLEKTQHGLWFGYKQHKAISRMGSQVANFVNQGDVKDIQVAQVKINSLIYRLSEAQDKPQVEAVIAELFNSLKEDGALDLALKAAEMEGSEQILGLGQTIAVCAVIAAATGGESILYESGGTLARALGIAKRSKDASTLARSAVQATRLHKMAKGIEFGASITTAENAIATISGEVRQNQDEANWLKDGMSTGLAMGLIAAFLPAGAQVANQSRQNLFKSLWQRYTSGGLIQGGKHLVMDTAGEIVEENVDQLTRKAMDGNFIAPSKHEIKDTSLTALAGGPWQMGMMAAKFAAVRTSSQPMTTPTSVSSEISNAKDRQKLDQFYTKHPELKMTLDKSKFRPKASLELLETIFEKAEGRVSAAYSNLHLALQALETTDWSSKQKHQFIILLTEKSRIDVHWAYENLPIAIEALKDTNWSSGQQRKFLTLLTKNTKEDAGWAYETLPRAIQALNATRWSSKQKHKLLTLLPEKAGWCVDASYENLRIAIQAMEATGWSPAQQTQLLALLAEKTKGNVKPAYENLSIAIQALKTTDWSSKQKYQFLTLLAEKAGWHVGAVYENLPTTMKALETTDWSSPQKHQLLTLLAEKAEFNLCLAYEKLPAALQALNTTDWSSKQKYQFLSSIAKKSFKETSIAYELLSSLQHWSPEHFQKSLQVLSRLLTCLSNYNRKTVLMSLKDNEDLFLSLGSDNFFQHFSLYATFFERWPRLGFNLFEGIIEITRKGIIPKDISDYRQNIFSFIERTNGFIPVLYEAYLQEGDALFPRLKLYTNAFLKDEFSIADAHRVIQAEGREFLLALIQMTSPTSSTSTVKKDEHLDLMEKMLAAGDLKDHIPLAWQGLVKNFNVEQGAWRLHKSQTADPEGKIQALLAWFRISEGDQIVEEQDVVAAFEQYFRSGRSKQAREEVKKLFYQLAGHNDALKEKIDRIQELDYTSLISLEQLFGDKDNLQKALVEILNKVSPELFVGQGKKRKIQGDGKRLTKKLKHVWAKTSDDKDFFQEKRIEILANILKVFQEEEIKNKILSRESLAPELKAAIIALLHQLPDISKHEIIKDILSEATQLIQNEKNKYTYQSTGEIQIGLRAVKGPAFMLHGLVSGICTEKDVELWKNPKFKLLAITDEHRSQVVGHIHVFETSINGKKYLTLPGINPAAEFMGSVNAGELYQRIMTQVQAFAEAGGYDGIYIPTSANIHSNRSDIQKAIQKSNYETRTIPEVKWNTLPKPYLFTEVYVAWERPIPDDKANETVPPASKRVSIDTTPRT